MKEEILTYAEAERLYEGSFGKVTIDGSVHGNNKLCGYCTFEDHRGFLTDKQCRQHNCLGKNCNFYLPKVGKEKVKSKKVNFNSEEMVNVFNKILKAHEGLKVMKAEADFKNGWNVSYIAISNYNEKALEEEIFKKCGERVKLIKLNYSFENAAKIIFK